MKAIPRSWRYLMTPLAFAGMLSISSAAELNPAAVTYKLPAQIPWGPVNAAGAHAGVGSIADRLDVEARRGVVGG